MQEEQIPENKKFLNERNDKPHQITMQLIAETSLQNQKEGEDQHIKQLIKLKTIHLEWLSISQIRNLQVFTDLTILYLQHNRIRKIEGLDSLINLEYLALSNNQISSVEHLTHLKKLQGLILSNNQIEQFDPKQLPDTLTVLSMKQNPVCLDVDYKRSILKQLKLLEVLDDQTITPADKFKILGLLPSKVASYASQMKQFYTKRQIQHKIDEDSKPLLFNTEVVNEKEALGEIRQATRKYKYQSSEAFKKQKTEQNEFFQEKLAVSKKIRSIKEEQEEKRTKRLEEIKSNTIEKLMLQRQ